jgi:hypothetical protein
MNALHKKLRHAVAGVAKLAECLLFGASQHDRQIKPSHFFPAFGDRMYFKTLIPPAAEFLIGIAPPF